MKNPTREAIIRGAAKGAYADEWARAIEEAHGEGRITFEALKSFLPGGREIEPPEDPPAACLRWARKLIKTIEDWNGVKVQDAFNEWMVDCYEGSGAPSSELFGHYLAMEAMGSGVAWSDSYPEHGLLVPSAACGFEVTRNGRFRRGTWYGEIDDRKSMGYQG